MGKRCNHCKYLFAPHEISLNHTNATKYNQGIIEICHTPSPNYRPGAGFKHVKKSLRKSLKKSLRKSKRHA